MTRIERSTLKSSFSTDLGRKLGLSAFHQTDQYAYYFVLMGNNIKIHEVPGGGDWKDFAQACSILFLR